MATDQEKLFRYCRWNNTKDVIKTLASNDNLDVLGNEGIAFIHATKHDNLVALNALLNYYTEHRLKGNIESLEYKKAVFSLKQVLDSLEMSYDLSEKMSSIIDSYSSTSKTQDDILDIIDCNKIKISGLYDNDFKEICKHWLDVNAKSFQSKKQSFEGLREKLLEYTAETLPSDQTLYRWCNDNITKSSGSFTIDKLSEHSMSQVSVENTNDEIYFDTNNNTLSKYIDIQNNSTDDLPPMGALLDELNF